MQRDILKKALRASASLWLLIIFATETRRTQRLQSGLKKLIATEAQRTQRLKLKC
ncbi:Uncharacterised protein [uncultured archaeon]|nr:Uncharacterised protein [uncultured archaeon]